MTIGELKKYIEIIPDEAGVCFCADGDNPVNNYWEANGITRVTIFGEDQTQDFICLISE